MKETDKWAYLASEQAFLEHRLSYYSDTKTISVDSLSKKIFPDALRATMEGIKTLEQRNNAIEVLRNSQAPITIVTATKERSDSLANAYKFLAAQTGSVDWNWVIIDNGEDEETKRVVAEFKDDRVLHVSYLEETGSASPVRNFGLDFVHYAKRGQVNDPGYVLVVDSDDKLYGENSLRELFKVANSRLAKSKGLYIAHGFADSEIHQIDKSIIHVPNPRDWDSSFPEVNSLAEVFDKGLNILSGMFPVDLLSWLRYPPEPSFEDDGFNQKIMLQAKKNNMIWIAERFPVTTKKFHQESMSGRNDQIGNVDMSGQVGKHIVTGIRAQIVLYLQKLSDYYTKEDL
ncbi:MAG: glycosyltransferase [Candidatus Woesebacteria bacterium]|nr:MAG: glycosyltransferase [Candidatus Woesebacteria bacterium]